MMTNEPSKGFKTLAAYMLMVWAALDEMRAEDERVIKAYFDRLVALSPSLEARPPWKASRPRGAWASRLWATLVTRARTIPTLLKGITLVPVLVLQDHKLRKLRMSAKEGGVLILGIASNRLPLIQHVKSARADLASYARPIGRCQTPDLPHRIRNADIILLFDPLPLSRYWEHRRGCWRENIFIVDGAFLLMTLLLAFMRDVRRVFSQTAGFLQECYAALMVQSGQRVKALKRAALCTWIAQSYSLLCEGFSSTTAIFFTRNSTLTDLLRGYLIYARHCRWMCELMHGVGSEREERFFDRVLSEGERFGAYEKHVFMPQLPDLPLYGVFEQLRASGNGMAVNAYVNKSLLDLSRSHDEIGAYIEAEYRSLCEPDRHSEEPIVVALFGTYWEDPTFFESPAFRAECLLVRLIAKTSNALGLNCLMLYVPHPSNPHKQLTHPVFDEHGVRIYRRSIVSWLITDVAVSLYSCAMFEAAYFGSRAFTPLTTADELYVPYLHLVDHPNSSLLAELSRALKGSLLSCVNGLRHDVVRKGVLRLQRMGWTAPTAEGTLF